MCVLFLQPDGDPLKEVFFHYNIEGHKGGVMCPKRNFGEECPICDFASKLWRDGTDNNDEETKKLAKSLFVRTRYFSPVVVRGLESEGVKVYGYGKTAYELLLGYILDPEYGDITDPVRWYRYYYHIHQANIDPVHTPDQHEDAP